MSLSELRLARRLYTQIGERQVLPDIDTRFFPFLKDNLFTLKPVDEENLERLNDYPEVAQVLTESGKLEEKVDPDFPPPLTGVHRLLLMVYQPISHELPGEIRDGREDEWGFKLLPLKTGWAGGLETVYDKLGRTGWGCFDNFLENYLHGGNTSIGLANVVVWKNSEGELSIGHIGMVDISKPFSRELLNYLSEEFETRIKVSNGVFISSSENGGHFIATDNLLNRGELIHFNAKAGKINHVESGGLEAFYVDDRFLWHMQDRYPQLYGCLRIIPFQRTKPFIPRITAFLKDGQLEFLPDAPLPILGRELLGAGLI